MEKAKPKKKLTLRDRKRAQPGAAVWFSEAEKEAIYGMVSDKLDTPQKNIFFYQCQALGLNPLISEIAAVPYYNKKTGKTVLSIQVMRDGFLTIAHRSGKFAGMKSGVKEHTLHEIKEGESEISEKIAKTRYVGWAKVYHKDFKVPLYQEADFEEYDNSVKNPLWISKPKTMIKKVAESMALRKAFNVSGVYAKEEMEMEIVNNHTPTKPLGLEGGDKPASETQLATLRSLQGVKKLKASYTKQEAADFIKVLSQKKGKKK